MAISDAVTKRPFQKAWGADMIEVFSFTEAGGHLENEDAFAVEPHPLDPECLLGVVADGQGGQPDGGPAARLASRMWLDAAGTEKPQQLFHGGMIEHTIHLVDRELCEEQNAGFTTLVGWSVWRNHLIGASAGDSALMLVQSDAHQILTDQQLKNPPVGSGAVEAVEFGAPLTPPWTILAMSDGVWKYAGWEKLAALAKEKRGQALIDAAVSLCRLKSGALQDDFTLIVWQAK
jgi:hypothetical protein